MDGRVRRGALATLPPCRRVAKAGVAALSDGEREALKGDWVEYFERHRSESSVCAPRPYLIIQGRRVG